MRLPLLPYARTHLWTTHDAIDPKSGILGPMRGPCEVLTAMGGASSSADLLSHCSKAAVRAAVADGDILRPRRGTYVLPSAPDSRRSAVRLGGVVSHESAALIWGMELLQPAPQAHVTVARSRRRLDARGCVLHWADVPRSDIRDRVTVPLRTVVDCARTSGFAQALAIADSALRLRLVTGDDLIAAAEALRGPGRQRALRVARAADARAESVLESALRALLIGSRIRGFEPQLWIRDERFGVRVDLAHTKHRTVLEAESFAHHGHRSALVRDCWRYTELSIRGWRVLRFAWEHVLFEPEWVVQSIKAAMASRP